MLLFTSSYVVYFFWFIQALSLDSVAIASRGVGNFAWTDDFTLPAAVTSDASDSDDDDVNDDVNDDVAKQPKPKKRKSALEEEKEIYKVLAARGCVCIVPVGVDPIVS